MKIAIVGSGVSGIVSAWVLRREHEITLFEASERLGGHAWTVDVDPEPADRPSEVRKVEASKSAAPWPVDLGFVVYNEATYPHFVEFLEALGVETQPTSMSFSVRCESTGFEYSGTSARTLFAQKRNLVRPKFYRFLAEIPRFNRLALEVTEGSDRASDLTLDAFLRRHGFSDDFRRYYLLPMAASIWSSTPRQILDFPVGFLFRFLANHRLLQAADHHPWRTICGGSREYVRRATAPFADRIRLRTPVLSIRRVEGSVELETADGVERFDRVVLATHSDQALRLIDSPTPREREILGAMTYQTNTAQLHRDGTLLPRRARARASWNFTVDRAERERPSVTYDMSRLHSYSTARPICVSLNQPDRVRPETILRELAFDHPVFTPGSVAAQARRVEIDGVDRLHFCGAYWGNGFHEDGVRSAVETCRAFGLGLQGASPGR